MADLLSLEISSGAVSPKLGEGILATMILSYLPNISQSTNTYANGGFYWLPWTRYYIDKNCLGLIKKFQTRALGPRKSSREVHFSPTQKKN